MSLLTPSTPAPAASSDKIHVAIIMDGNGRWATARGHPRTAGHVVGARTVRSIVESAESEGVGTLTLYAFSADNWQRPSREVSMLMRLFRRYLLSDVDRCVRNGVRLRVIGRRDRLPGELQRAIQAAEEATREGTRLELRIALDYSAREAILGAARQLAIRHPAGRAIGRDDFAQAMNEVTNAGPVRDVDLLIRTGGEQRLSDFLLWECAYAELYFTQRMWPEFSPADLHAAVRDFHARERRFGAISEAVAAAG